MIKLFVGDEKGEVQDATIPVRWCIDKETIKELKEKKVEKPYILLVTTSKKEEMTRQLTPLDDLMGYIQFQRPGENIIFATIVWDQEKSYFELWKKYLSKRNGRYKTDVYYPYEGKFIKNLDDNMEFAEVNVTVPSELFAKEYPAWEKRLVEFMFSTSSRDQCQYRERRFIAYPTMPFLLLSKFVVNCVITIFLLLCGIRDINFSPLLYLITHLM